SRDFSRPSRAMVFARNVHQGLRASIRDALTLAKYGRPIRGVPRAKRAEMSLTHFCQSGEDWLSVGTRKSTGLNLTHY
ncbi:MAG: hypothetical protein ACYC4B_30645, partial [Pirellulaceae bacterium]